MRALPVSLSTRTARSSRVMPAAGTHIVTVSNWLLIESKTDARNASSVVSPRKAYATRRPAAALTSSAIVLMFSPMSTSANARTLRRANSPATARPMPLAAPVITATLPAISIYALSRLTHCSILRGLSGNVTKTRAQPCHPCKQLCNPFSFRVSPRILSTLSPFRTSIEVRCYAAAGAARRRRQFNCGGRMPAQLRGKSCSHRVS